MYKEYGPSISFPVQYIKEDDIIEGRANKYSKLVSFADLPFTCYNGHD